MKQQEYTEEQKRWWFSGFRNAAPAAFDFKKDSQSVAPWSAPWMWADFEDYALSIDPWTAGMLFAEKHHEAIEQLMITNFEDEYVGA